jgi:hypothetical protein
MSWKSWALYAGTDLLRAVLLHGVNPCPISADAHRRRPVFATFHRGPPRSSWRDDFESDGCSATSTSAVRGRTQACTAAAHRGFSDVALRARAGFASAGRGTALQDSFSAGEKPGARASPDSLHGHTAPARDVCPRRGCRRLPGVGRYRIKRTVARSACLECR